MVNPAFGKVPATAITSLRSFTFHVSDEEIQEFKQLLSLSKLAPETWYNKQQDTTYGLKFEWQQQESHLNSIPNFMTTVEHRECGPVSLHFAALFSSRPDALPVICMHSWPGAFFEYLPIMHILAQKYTPETLPYHIIVPSLPGFGPSTAPLGVELTYNHTAEVMHQLMMDLGFGAGYIAQGGDVGSSLARIMSAKFSDCKAIHITMLMAENEHQTFKDEPLASHDKVLMERMNTFMTTGISYALFNGLRPSTAGLAISSSPLALLAYIGEKLVEWADNRFPLSLDTILGIASFYWHTSTFARSLFQYPELAKSFINGVSMEPPMERGKPFGYSSFAGDIVAMPYSWAKKAHPNMISYTKHKKGGHYPALEQPEELLTALEDFVSVFNKTIGRT